MIDQDSGMKIMMREHKETDKTKRAYIREDQNMGNGEFLKRKKPLKTTLSI